MSTSAHYLCKTAEITASASNLALFLPFWEVVLVDWAGKKLRKPIRTTEKTCFYFFSKKSKNLKNIVDSRYSFIFILFIVIFFAFLNFAVKGLVR